MKNKVLDVFNYYLSYGIDVSNVKAFWVCLNTTANRRNKVAVVTTAIRRKKVAAGIVFQQPVHILETW